MGLVLDGFFEKFCVYVEHLETLSRIGDTFLITGNEIRLLFSRNKRNFSNLRNESGSSTPDEPDPSKSDRSLHTAEYAAGLAEELEKIKKVLPDYDYRIRWSRESVEWYEKIRGITPSNIGDGNGTSGNQNRNDWKQARKEWVQFYSDDDSGRQASNGGDLYGGNGISSKKASLGPDMIEGYSKYGKSSKNNLNQYTNETDKETSNDGLFDEKSTPGKQASPSLDMIEEAFQSTSGKQASPWLAMTEEYGKSTSGKQASPWLAMIEEYGKSPYGKQASPWLAMTEEYGKSTSEKQASPWLAMIEEYGKYGKPAKTSLNRYRNETKKGTSNDENGVADKQARACEVLSNANANAGENTNKIPDDYDDDDDNVFKDWRPRSNRSYKSIKIGGITFIVEELN